MKNMKMNSCMMSTLPQTNTDNNNHYNNYNTHNTQNNTNQFERQ
jgi:hypothetical protein